MNSLVIQQHHQILSSVNVNVPLHIPDVPGIPSLQNISTSSTSDMPHPPTYENLHRHLLPKKDGCGMSDVELVEMF